MKADFRHIHALVSGFLHDRRCIVAAVPILCAAALVLTWLFCLPRDLFQDVPYSTVVLDRDGELLGARTASDGQWRFPPPSEDVELPQRYVRCLVEFEDRRFPVHRGVDPISIFRAFFQNIRAGHTVSGGSTLTMQVIRLSRSEAVRLSSARDSVKTRGQRRISSAKNSSRRRGITDKIVEAFLATRLESRCSKSEILKLYAAHAPFGGNVVGLEAASRRYFGRPCGELSWAEAATLAVLPNSPSLIHPGRNRELLLRKRNRLLSRLHENGVIDEETLELSVAEPLPDSPKPFPNAAPHIVERLNRTNAGQEVRTGISLPLQKNLEALTDRCNRDFSQSSIRDLSAVIIDVHTGDVLAYCGNANPSDGRDGSQVDIADSPRSTGSVLKPFLYAAMLQSGDILPNTLIADTPLNVGGFTPQNFDMRFSGAVPASEALTRSLNVPYVRMLRSFGVQEFCSLLANCGMTTLTRSSSDYGLSLILGGAEGKLEEITKMYAALSACCQGLNSWIPKNWPLTDRCSLWWTLTAMGELNRPDELDPKLVPSLHRIAWKTGTSYGFRDAWAVGVTKDYAVGVWAGNANGESAPGLVGARTAGPVLFDIYNMLPSSKWFDEPSADDGVYAEVCHKSGHLCGASCEEKDSLFIPAAGLRSSVCPYHRKVFLTPDGSRRLSSPSEGCIVKSFFVLPPAMEWYWRRVHPDYVPLPPYSGASSTTTSPLAFIYPEPGSTIFIPRRLDGTLGEAVFSLAHTSPDTDVFWHLDSDYVGRTRFIHSLSLHPSPGVHTLTAVDSEGNSSSVKFTVSGD